MDPQARFENRFEYDFRTLRKVYSVMMASRRRIYIIVGVAFLALGVFGMPKERINLLGVTLLGVMVLYAILLPTLTAWFSHRQHRKLINGARAEVTASYTDEQIVMQEGPNRSCFQYEQLVRIRSGREFWLLMIGRTIAIPVAKEGFTQGNPQDFEAFIRSKCPEIKGTFN